MSRKFELWVRLLQSPSLMVYALYFQYKIKKSNYICIAKQVYILYRILCAKQVQKLTFFNFGRSDNISWVMKFLFTLASFLFSLATFGLR